MIINFRIDYTTMRHEQIKRLVIFIFTCELVGILGSVFNTTAIAVWWYGALSKPWFTPPGWVFGPVWAVLYVLMGVAAYLVWESKKEKKLMPFAKSAFCWQLAFNLCWSIFFFGFRNLGQALADIALLWVSLAITIGLFYRISKKAAWLLVPYLIWVTIALALNFCLLKLN